MTYESIYDEVKEFINDELDDFKAYPDCYSKEDIDNNTTFLNNLSEKDIEKIGNMIMDDEELKIKLRETIKWYIYHCKKEEERDVLGM